MEELISSYPIDKGINKALNLCQNPFPIRLALKRRRLFPFLSQSRLLGVISATSISKRRTYVHLIILIV